MHVGTETAAKVSHQVCGEIFFLDMDQKYHGPWHQPQVYQRYLHHKWLLLITTRANFYT